MTEHDQDFAAAQSYVGRDYIPGHYDCGHLFLDVQREVFGRRVVLPSSVPYHAQGRAHQASQINAVRDALAVRHPAPVHGCAVLMQSHAADGGLLWHVGTIFEHQAQAWVLHNSAALGSSALHRLQDFGPRGQRIEGFYIWK